MKKLLSVLLLTAMMSVMLCACGGSKGIKFGTNAEFPPFEYVTAAGVIGEYDGIDMAIAKEIGVQSGMDISIENMEFDSLLIALENGQIDAVISGMTITEERAKSVDFSIPYYTATQVMIVDQNSDIKTAADMADKRIVVIQGYTGENCVQELGYDYEAFKKGTEAILELNNGKCDVVVIDSATAQKYVKDNPNLKIVEDPSAFEAEEYGIAVKKGNTELLNKINSAIEKMLADGTISEWSVSYSEEE
ncbi:MAG: basic amino acid ABC transporter substrate-binding protein [Lachnospiraceae bacterium]|nr:basic amino acid ABC transporter substrate-binding protein [Lachnospiraceae bacterium]MBP5414908.1 basic amino acid ABC transporter substrate-binding protein [Lachnospiraceae bacterium]MBP5745289.1 basic amino acid ABC transporter substrate-binding protein [Lachnospiraceae bacterium]